MMEYDLFDLRSYEVDFYFQSCHLINISLEYTWPSLLTTLLNQQTINDCIIVNQIASGKDFNGKRSTLHGLYCCISAL